jgi:multimeric flavodoxin WrbA/putative sterol carrier protein
LTLIEGATMETSPVVVAVNGSPHIGAGNTGMMLAMIGEELKRLGLRLEIIYLTDHRVEYCIGCGHCLESGRCWVPDDHATILERLLAADAVVLASPVYFFHVTAQMKTFLDRSLALGHKPRATWKPGLAVSVSAGSGETAVADYLEGMLRVYGAFPVGSLTALATVPGGFMGREAVEARAVDLARDLARALRERRRYPATETDLRYYNFMSALVRDNRDSVMRHDFDHWEKLGLNRGFEAYVQQARAATAPHDSEARKAWLKELRAGYLAQQAGRGKESARPSPGSAAPPPASCQELLRSMPAAFNRPAAEGLSAVYEFRVSGEESFTAHLTVADGACTYADGPADRPGLVIHTPAGVWMSIARGELDGQAAFMSGRFTAEGDLTLLFKLKTLFR